VQIYRKFFFKANSDANIKTINTVHKSLIALIIKKIKKILKTSENFCMTYKEATSNFNIS